MKKLISLLLALVAILCLGGCHNAPSAVKSPVAYYYPVKLMYQSKPIEHHGYRSDRTIIESEIREAQGHEGDYIYLLNTYFSGPQSQDLASPFPYNLSVLEFNQAGNTIVIHLSKSYTQLSGIDLTLASACIAKTVYDMTGCGRVQISVPDETLDGSPYLTINQDQLIFSDVFAEPDTSEE